jgi:hypothetical protein
MAVFQMLNFLGAWDFLELCHPWGVNVFATIMDKFGIPPNVYEEVDSRLFLDLIPQVLSSTRRIRVEGRHTPTLFWVHVVLCYPFAVVSFQRQPNAPMERAVSIMATPGSLVACILAFYRWELGKNVHGCGRVRVHLKRDRM